MIVQLTFGIVREVEIVEYFLAFLAFFLGINSCIVRQAFHAVVVQFTLLSACLENGTVIKTQLCNCLCHMLYHAYLAVFSSISVFVDTGRVVAEADAALAFPSP